MSAKSKKKVALKRNKPLLIPLFIVLVLASILLVIIMPSDSSENGDSERPITLFEKIFQKKQVNVPAATAPPKPLPTGKQVYNFSHGENVTGPKPTKVTINPLDPNKLFSQTLEVIIVHDKPVSIAKITVNTDNESIEHNLELVKGTDTNGTWKGSWKITDTYNQTYSLKFNLESDGEVFDGSMVFRQ